MGLRKNIFHIGLYQINRALTMLVPFITIPVATRILNVDEFGVLQNLQSFSEVLSIFFAFYIASAYTRYYYDYRHDHDLLAKLTSTCFYFLCGIGLLFIVPSVVAGYFFLKLINTEPSAYKLIIVFLLPFSLFFFTISTIAISYLRQEKRNLSINLVDTVNSVLSLGIILLCLVSLKKGIDSFFYATLITGMLSSIFGITVLLKFKLLKFTFSFSILKPCLRFAILSLPMSLSSWIYGFSDQVILAIYGGVGLSGKYALVYKVSRVTQALYISFYHVLNPYLIEYLKEHTSNQKTKVLNLLNLGMAILAAGSLFVIYFSKPILNLLAPEQYHLSPIIVLLVVISFIFIGVRKYTDSILWYHKRLLTMFLIVGFFPSVLNVILNIIFIPYFYEYAAVLTTLFSAFLVMILSIYINSKIEKIVWDIRITFKFGAVFVIGAGVYTVLLLMNKLELPYLIPAYFILMTTSFFIFRIPALIKKLFLS